MADDNALTNDFNFEVRRVLSKAYAFVQGQHAATAFAGITFEDLARQQLERIEGMGTATRPTELERLDRLEFEIINMATQLKRMPSDRISTVSPDDAVNTPPESGE